MSNIAERISKLFALGQSPNPHEAANAIRKARELMAEYGVDEGQLGKITEETQHEIIQRDVVAFTLPEYALLGSIVADMSFCASVQRTEGFQKVLSFYGRAYLVASAVDLYLWLTGCMNDALVEEGVRGANKQQSFKAGWIDAVRESLKTMVDSDRAGKLVLCTRAELENYRKEQGYVVRPIGVARRDSAAYNAGVAKGRSFNLQGRVE